MNKYMQDKFRTLLKQAAALLSSSIFSSVLLFISFALTARSLGAESFGLLIIASTFVTLVDRLTNFQSWQALIKFGGDCFAQNNPKKLHQYIKSGFLIDLSSMLFSLTICLSTVYIIPPLLGWDNDVIDYVLICSIMLATNLVGTPTAILRLNSSVKPFVYASIATSITKLILVAIAFFNNASIYTFCLIWAVSISISHLIIIYSGYKTHLQQRAPSKALLSNREKRELYKFVAITNVQTSARAVTKEGDVMVIASLLEPSIVAVYKTAKQIAQFVNKLADPIKQLIYPEISKLAANKEYSLLTVFNHKIALFTGLAAFSVLAVYLIIGMYFIELFFGSSFTGAYSIGGYLILGTSLFLIGIYTQSNLLSFGKPSLLLSSDLLFGGIYILSTYIFAKLSGIEAVAISYAAVQFAMTLYLILKTQRVIATNKAHGAIT